MARHAHEVILRYIEIGREGAKVFEADDPGATVTEQELFVPITAYVTEGLHIFGSRVVISRVRK